MKTLVVYMPLSWGSISRRVFKSFIDMTGPDVQEELAELGYKLKFLINDTFPLDRNRNQAIEKARSSKYEADVIFFADGDQIWPKDTLKIMLSKLSDEFPVVSGLYWKKAYPHACVQGHYSPWTKDLELKRKSIESIGFVDENGNQTAFYRPLLDFSTTQPIDVSGMGCLMARSDVFDKIELPYFGYFNSYSLGGDYTITHMSEEMLFFSKLHKAGVKTLLVPEIKCGHEVTKVIGCPEGNE